VADDIHTLSSNFVLDVNLDVKMVYSETIFNLKDSDDLYYIINMEDEIE